ncbi:MAG: hypothetical protein U5L95_04170 [Candidatus Saccharibacteria bacterium]|nr:hypothetical protein [Candidatus Saccharibacteria bacterium]
MPTNFESPSISGEEQRELQSFKQRTIARLYCDHPDLSEKWIPRLDDADAHERLFSLTSLHAILDVRDSRKAAEDARQRNNG